MHCEQPTVYCSASAIHIWNACSHSNQCVLPEVLSGPSSLNFMGHPLPTTSISLCDCHAELLCTGAYHEEQLTQCLLGIAEGVSIVWRVVRVSDKVQCAATCY